MTYIERKSCIDALILEYYPDSPEAEALNKKDIYLKPRFAFTSIDDLIQWNK